MRIPDESRLALARKGILPAVLLLAGLTPVGETEAAPPRSSRTQRATTVAAARPIGTHDLANRALGLSASRMVRLASEAGPGESFVTDLRIDDEVYTLDVAPFTLRSVSYELLVQQDDGSLASVEPQPVRTVRGSVLEIPGSIVVGSRLDDGLHVAVYLPGEEKRFWIEPVPQTVAGAGDGDHLVYHDDDVLRQGGCGTLAEATDALPDMLPLGGGVAGGAVNQGDCFWFTEIAIDADHEYFLALGSVGAVESRVNTIITTMNEQYERDVDIHFQISTIIVRAAANDPYSSTTSANSLLTQFQAHWNAFQTTVPRDVAQLFTGRNIEQGGNFDVIGIANYQDICTASAYGLVENISGLAFQTDLSAHELGHNWSADHCTCTGSTMNAELITPSNQFHPTFTIPEIVTYRTARQFCLYENCVPSNDDCSEAILVDAGQSYLFSTINSTTDGPSDSLCSFDGDAQVESDVWFRYVAPCDGIFTVDLCGSEYNTKLAVYENACPVAANLAIACSDESGACPGNQSQLTFTGQENVSYYLRVGGSGGAQGVGSLLISEPASCQAAPSNDACGGSMVVSEGVTPFSTLGATTDGPDEGLACTTSGTQIDNDIWYRYANACDGTMTVSLCNADFDTAVAIYESSCPTTPGTIIACNDDACGLQSEVSFPSTAGTIYRLRIGGVDDAAGSGDITIVCTAGPACPGDTDGNGIVDVDDLNNIIMDWGTDGSANGGDLVGQTDDMPDGFVDVNDLTQVIVNWGLCPGGGPATTAQARG